MSASVPLSTYDSARGLSLGGHSELLSVSSAELSAREALPFLDACYSRCVEAALFFRTPSRGELLSSSSSSSSVGEEWVSASSDVTSEVPFWRGPLLVPLAFFLAFFSGAW